MLIFQIRPGWIVWFFLYTFASWQFEPAFRWVGLPVIGG